MCYPLQIKSIIISIFYYYNHEILVTDGVSCLGVSCRSVPGTCDCSKAVVLVFFVLCVAWWSRSYSLRVFLSSCLALRSPCWESREWGVGLVVFLLWSVACVRSVLVCLLLFFSLGVIGRQLSMPECTRRLSTVDSTLNRRCFNVVCLLGIYMLLLLFYK